MFDDGENHLKQVESHSEQQGKVTVESPEILRCNGRFRQDWTFLQLVEKSGEPNAKQETKDLSQVTFLSNLRSDLLDEKEPSQCGKSGTDFGCKNLCGKKFENTELG